MPGPTKSLEELFAECARDQRGRQDNRSARITGEEFAQEVGVSVSGVTFSDLSRPVGW